MKGKIDISRLSTPPQKHEFETAKYFADMGKDIIFIQPSNIPGVYRPDIIMDGIEWEIKCPQGKAKRTIYKNYHKASLQSKNIIFDLRRICVPEKESISQLKNEFKNKHSQRLIIIKKSGEIVYLQ